MNIKITHFLTRNKDGVITLLIILLAFSLSFYRLSSRDLWYDEAINYFRALTLRFFIYDFYPPLFYYILHFFLKFGDSEFVLRSLSAISGTFVVLFLFLLGRKILGREIAIFSSILFAISPMRIWYAQECSIHIMAVLWVLFSLYIFYLFTLSPSNKYMLMLTLANLLAICTSYYALIIIIGEVFYLFVNYRYKFIIWRKFLYSLGISSIIYFNHLVSLLKKIHVVKNVFWLNSPGLKILKYSIENFFLGYNGDVISNNLIFIIFILSTFRCFQKYRLDKSNIFIISFSLIPLLTVFWFSQYIPIYLDRHNMIFIPGIYFLMTRGCYSLNSKVSRAIFLIILVTILHSLVNYQVNIMPSPLKHHIGVHPKKNIVEIRDYIYSHKKNDDMIAVTSPSLWMPLGYYTHEGIFYFSSKNEDRYYRKLLQIMNNPRNPISKYNFY